MAREELDDDWESLERINRVTAPNRSRRPAGGKWSFFAGLMSGWLCSLVGASLAAGFTSGAKNAGYVLFSSACAASMALIPFGIFVGAVTLRRWQGKYKQVLPQAAVILWFLLLCVAPLSLALTYGVVRTLPQPNFIVSVGGAAGGGGLIVGWLLAIWRRRSRSSGDGQLASRESELPPDAQRSTANGKPAEPTGDFDFGNTIELDRYAGLGDQRIDRDLAPRGHAAEVTADDLREDATYRFRERGFFDRHGSDLYMGAVILLVGLFALGFVPAISQANQVALPAQAAVYCAFALVILFGAYLIFGFIQRYRHAPREVTVGDWGIAVANAFGTIERGWNDVVRVWRSEFVLIQRRHAFEQGVESWISNTKVEFFSGKPLEFDHSLSGYNELINRIQAYTARIITPQLLEKWKRAPLTFGPVRLEHDRVVIASGFTRLWRNVAIPFDDLDMALVRNGCLVLGADSTKKRFEVALCLIPNYTSLLSLLEIAAPKCSADDAGLIVDVPESVKRVLPAAKKRLKDGQLADENGNARPRSRRPLIIASVIGVFGVLLAVMGVVAYRKQHPPAEARPIAPKEVAKIKPPPAPAGEPAPGDIRFGQHAIVIGGSLVEAGDPPRPPDWFLEAKPQLHPWLAEKLARNTHKGLLAPDSPFWERLKRSVEKREFKKADLMPNAAGPAEFEDLPPNGGLLIGFFVAKKSPRSYCQPIYLTSKGEIVGRPFGVQEPDALCIKARPGYAVGGFYIHSGDNLHALALTFMKIDETGLNRKDSYQSKWAGSDGGAAAATSHDGAFLIGIHGRALEATKLAPKGALSTMSPLVVP